MAGAIGVGTVEKRDALIERVANEGDAVVVADLAVDAGQRHAAEPDGGGFDAGGTKFAFGKAFAHGDIDPAADYARVLAV